MTGTPGNVTPSRKTHPQINRLNFLLYVLPPAIAFCIANIFALYDEQDNYDHLMRELEKQKFPGLFASAIGGLFTNSYGLLAGTIPGRLATPFGKFNNSFYVTVQNIFMILGPLVLKSMHTCSYLAM